MSSGLKEIPCRPNLFKRPFDLVFAGVGLILTMPLMAVVAVLTRLAKDGPVIFRQARVGLRGEVFQIHKFRSMRIDAPGVMVSPTGDLRVTPVGRWLRRTKMDELPQLYDVLVGRMSIVGPRPEVPEYVTLWPADEREIILSVRPGITDPASILFRHEAEELARARDAERYYVETVLPRKVALYVRYATTSSFGGDLVIIIRTAAAVLRMTAK